MWSIASSPTPVVGAVRGLVRDVAGQVRALVAVAADERVHDVAVGGDRRELDLAEVVLHDVRLDNALGAARDRLAIGVGDVGHAQRDVLHAVAVSERVPADRAVAAHRARDDEADLVLLEHVARAIAHARLGAGVRGAAKAERVLVVERRLLRVPHPQLDVVPARRGA